MLVTTGQTQLYRHFLNVASVAASQEQHGCRFVQHLDEREILDVDTLSGTTSSATGSRSGLASTPAKGEDFDLFLVLVVSTFTLDAIHLDKTIESHNSSPYLYAKLCR